MSTGAVWLPRQGDVVWAKNVLDPNGSNPKDGRVIVVTEDIEIRADGVLQAAVVTGSLRQPFPPNVVEMRWSATFCNSGFNKPCYAVGFWLIERPVAEFTSRAGYLDTAKLAEVIAAVNRSKA